MAYMGWALTDTLPDPPDSISLPEFLYDSKYRLQKSDKKHTFVCGVTGNAVKVTDAKERVESIARALSKRTGWVPVQEETEWEKIACIFSINAVSISINTLRQCNLYFAEIPEAKIQRKIKKTDKGAQIDYITVAHAVQRLNGIVTPASAAYNQQELEYQLKATNATVLFTSAGPLLETALKAADNVKLPRDRVFIIDTAANGFKPVAGHVTVAQLVADGAKLPQLPSLQWVPGQGARQVAFICFSSGTSGLPVSLGLSCLGAEPRVTTHEPITHAPACSSY